MFGSGVLEQGLTFDLAKLIMDAEMMRMIQVATQGISVTDENLAVEVIHEVGSDGTYIAHDTSLKHMRNQSRSNLFDRRNRKDWMELIRGKAIQERAYEAAMDILQNHKPLPFPDNAAREITDHAHRTWYDEAPSKGALL